jgi:bacterioferritin
MIYLVRHGQSEDDVGGDSYYKNSGLNPTPLTDMGNAEAREVGEFLKDRGIKKVYASNTVRGKQCGEIIAQVVGAKMESTDGLWPWKIGVYTGMKEKEGDPILEDRLGNGIVNFNDMIRTNPDKKLESGNGNDGESFRDFLKRFIGFVTDYMKKDDEGPVVFATHSKNVRAMAAWTAAGCKGLEYDPNAYYDCHTETGEVRQLVDQGNGKLTMEQVMVPGQQDQTIYLMRHGATDYNSPDPAKHRVRGQKDIPMTKEGIAQVEATAKAFKGTPIDTIYTSTLGRTVATANIMSEATGAKVLKTSALLPWDMGEMTGKLLTDVKPEKKEFMYDKPDEKIPGGESYSKFAHKVIDFVRTTALMSNKPIMLVTHSEVIKVIEAWVDAGGNNYKLEENSLKSDYVNTAGILVLRKTGGKLTIDEMDGTGVPDIQVPNTTNMAKETQMKGDQKVIDTLNDNLSDELTAVNQYMVHSEINDNNGYKELADYQQKRAIDEMKHAEMLIGRILFLDGTPVVSKYRDINIGTEVPKQFDNDHKSEEGAIAKYNGSVEICRAAKDNDTRTLIESILKDEIRHIDEIENNQKQIKDLGLPTYLAEQI